MARVEDGGESHAGLQWADDDLVDGVILDEAGFPKVDRVDDFVIPVSLVTLGIFGLASMTC